MKRYFIIFTLLLWMVLAILSIYCLLEIGFRLATLGMLVSTLLPIVFFLGLDISSGSKWSIGQIIRIAVFLISTLLILLDYEAIGLIIIIVYTSNIMMWVLYIFWYSKLDYKESENLVLGETLPEIQFETYNDEPYYVSQLLGRKVVFLFYRGNWCPVDMAQVKELAIQYEDIKNTGAEVLMISPQPHGKTKELVEKLGVEFKFLMDKGNNIAMQLGIDNENGVPLGIGMNDYEKDTVLPTTIIADENQKIIYLNQTNDYRVRPESNSFLSILGRKDKI
ncbi:MAG: redoxin domain-containing protein [Bacteroidota bacterium]